MKITRIEPLPVSAGGAAFFLVVVHTDEGLHGLGEVGIRSRPATVAGAVRDVAERAVGADVTRIEHLWQLLYRGAFFPADRDVGAVLAAVDLALWDLRGKALGVPVCDLLGGRTRDHVPAYVHLNGYEPEEYLDNAHRLVAAGWTNLRIAVGDQPGGVFEPRRALRRTLDVVAALRAGLDDDIEIIIDVHTRLDPAEAVLFCHEVTAMRPLFVEDPLRCENLDAYRSLRQRTTVPLAAGEQLTTKWEFRQLIEDDLIDHARIDLANTGITEGRKIAAMAEAHYISVATHNPLGPVCTAASTHVNLSLPNVSVQEQTRPHGWDDALVLAAPRVEAGTVVPADLPGLGVEIDLDAARSAASTVALGPPARFHRPDGSVTNW
ncbi:mandelate racemase/muconate lactonizing enzyme family protein [Jiangella asiatica]|nr:mandelate racemase/muconate lactonizing enzyme family protein [Jiangella asiatica]